MSDNYVNLLINEKIPIQNELNLEQHKKIYILQKKERNKKKIGKRSLVREKLKMLENMEKSL